ncbi:MAG: hypothetical protein Q8J78_06750 [Moraxellaceae bacterium]|nr:hypothetical protein [Moraxellaceae bacterium]
MKTPLDRQIRRAQIVTALLESAVCALLGLIAGIIFAAGYLADLPPWIR